ncbi:hypothetical protein [Paraburkholderia acidisoli]|uniref:Uncharacterized protein n=1 Tax=Paraburkholderia acidisoli TaxID=2571748 RepID=A0A7Z2JEV2_9BURK|nr:hypothetical protein [Paraburkholderia acidisoli]QGZ60485.1 hypothetical protein FAZ98_01340 [Paraburkholderia acidisoli]
MHVAYASFSFACAAPVTAVAALFFVSAVAARSRNLSRESNLSRIVLRRQPASRPPMTAIAYDTLKNEARHVA